MSRATAIYHDRMRRARDHIDNHLSESLDLARVSAVAAFSPAHFHRQFRALFGMNVYRYIQLARLKRAAAQLAYKNASVTHIAFEAGYETPEAFSRAFCKRIGQTPSAFRQMPDWEAVETACDPLLSARLTIQTQHFSPEQISIREVTPIRVAIMTHTGSPATIDQTIGRFRGWRRANGLNPQNSTTFTLFHDDANSVPAASYRLGFCVGTERVVASLGEQIDIGYIPAGRCAVLTVTGNINNLEAAAHCLYRDWLPMSGEETRDFPLYCQRIAFYPEVPDHRAVADLFLPLA